MGEDRAGELSGVIVGIDDKRVGKVLEGAGQGKDSEEAEFVDGGGLEDEDCECFRAWAP